MIKKKLEGKMDVMMPVPKNENLWIETTAVIGTYNLDDHPLTISFENMKMLLAVYSPGQKSDFIEVSNDQPVIELEWKHDLHEWIYENLVKVNFTEVCEMDEMHILE